MSFIYEVIYGTYKILQKIKIKLVNELIMIIIVLNYT